MYVKALDEETLVDTKKTFEAGPSDQDHAN